MSETRKREKWFKMLDQELTKYFNEKEKKDIISYYEELIDDRLDQRESIDDVLDAYDPKKIAKLMIPEVMSKRSNSNQQMTKNIWLIVLILFSTPILIPLGVVYLSLMISAFSVLISGGAVIVAGIGAVITQIIRSLSMGLAFSQLILTIGIALLALFVCLFIGYYLIKISWWVLQHLAIWFSQLIIRKRHKNEIH